jgi:hypothetical protein
MYSFKDCLYDILLNHFYDKKILTGFAASDHHWDRNTPSSNRILVRTLSRSRIKQPNDRESDSHANGFCRCNFTSRFNRLDYVDGSHYCIDRGNTHIIQTFNLDEIIITIIPL